LQQIAVTFTGVDGVGERIVSEKNLTPVGWRERVDLPDWGVTGLIAKIDTGARTSAIHVEGLSVPKPGLVKFSLVLSRKDKDQRISVEAPVVRETKVKSSSGHISHRYVVRTTMKLKNVERVIEISLVSRPEMIRRLLIGRQALTGFFVVDPSLTPSNTTTDDL
jgi:hypothetical protein